MSFSWHEYIQIFVRVKIHTNVTLWCGYNKWTHQSRSWRDPGVDDDGIDGGFDDKQDEDKHGDDGVDDTGKGLLVGVNIGEHVDPGVDGTKVEMTLVFNHHP